MKLPKLPKKPSNKVLLIGIVALATVTIIATKCGKDGNATEKNNKVSTNTLEPYIPPVNTEPPSPEEMLPNEVADYFLTSLVDGDYDTAYFLMDVTDDTFFTYDDFVFVAKRSDFGWIINNSSVYYSGVSTSINKNFAYSTATFNDVSGNVVTIPFRLRLDADNNWKIIPRPFCQENVTIISPTGTECYLDDTFISEDYLTDTAGSYDYYELPCVARKTWETHVISPLFGDANNKLEIPALDLNYWASPEYQSEVPEYRVDTTVSNKLFKEVQGRLTEIFDALYKNMEAGSDLSSIQQYVSPNTPLEFFRKMYESGKQEITANQISEIHLIKIVELEEYSTFIETENQIIANVGISRNWLSNNVLCSNKIVTAVQLEKIDNNWYLTDCYSNPFTNWTDGVNEWILAGQEK